MSAIIEVSVVPNSSAFKIIQKDGKIKVHLRSAPEKNKANLELIKELSALLGCTVSIISGQTSKRKKLRVDVSESEFQKLVFSQCTL